jgi:hypothetical protein
MLLSRMRLQAKELESPPDVIMAIDCSFITDLFLVRTPRGIIQHPLIAKP